MVLDFRAFDYGIRNKFVLIKGRSSRGVQPFASEFSPSSVGVPLIEHLPCMITFVNSDGGLPLDCQVLDSRGKELRDVDQKYGSRVRDDPMTLTFSAQNTT